MIPVYLNYNHVLMCITYCNTLDELYLCVGKTPVDFQQKKKKRQPQ